VEEDIREYIPCVDHHHTHGQARQEPPTAAPASSGAFGIPGFTFEFSSLAGAVIDKASIEIFFDKLIAAG
jgi:hypothetical protein